MDCIFNILVDHHLLRLFPSKRGVDVMSVRSASQSTSDHGTDRHESVSLVDTARIVRPVGTQLSLRETRYRV